MTINRCPDPLNFSYLRKKVKRYQKVSACLVVNSFPGLVSINLTMVKFLSNSCRISHPFDTVALLKLPTTKVGLSSAGMTAVQARGGFEWSPLEGGYRNLLSKCGHGRQVTNFCPKCSLQRRFC